MTLANLEAEAEVVGGLMQHNPLIDTVADMLDPDDFSEALLGRIYAAIVREASLGKPANPITLKGYFDADPAMQQLGGTIYLAELTGNAVGIGTRDTAKLVVELAQRRRMMEGLQLAALSCRELATPLAEIVSEADAALMVTGKDSIHQPTGAECIAEVLNGLDANREGITCRWIASLDALLGPLKPKQLIIGAGRPGMGKTALALSYALGAARNGHGVLFISLEMSSTELGARMASDLCFDGQEGVPFNAIRDGRLNDWQRRKVAEAHSIAQGIPFRVVDTGNLTLGRLNMLIRRHARRMEAQGNKLELVIVDYLQLLSPDTKGRSNYEAVSEVSKGLKAMAKDHGVAVFALAQLSRTVEQRQDRRPQLSDLRDSGQIEQDADAVLFLRREEYYLRQDEPDAMSPNRPGWEALIEQHKGQIEFILAKRRNGVTGNAMGQFHGFYQAVRG